MVDVIKINDIKISRNIEYAFFGRKGGVSKGAYESLNIGLERGDNIEDVKENLNIIAKYFGVNKILRVKQDHTNIVKVFKEDDKDITGMEGANADFMPIADAIVTNQRNVLISTKSADCIPALLFDEKNEIIACAHGSWKSTQLGIFENTIDEMLKIGANIDNIVVLIGPCLRQQSFEITSEFYDKFLSENKDNEKYFKATNKEGVYLFDNVGYAKDKILKKGVKNIYDSELDTYSNPDRFFSRRKSLHMNTNKDDKFNGDVRFGIQASAIILRG